MHIKRLTEDALTVDKIDDISAEVTVVSGKTTVEIRLEQYDFREIDVSQTLAPVFRHLKIDDHLKPLGDH
ncbi:MAG: hypothetical protein LC808_19805 [Actinobacteria bacterium]|nr:hypothetical protein [Actinomycetota bacterium]